MIEACRKNKKALSIGYRLQHEPSVQAYRGMVKEQTLGKVVKVSSASGYPEDRTDHWKQKKEMGGGVMHDMGVYAIQGARMGREWNPFQ
jgi:glucose-fructose oxidoreductase